MIPKDPGCPDARILRAVPSSVVTSFPTGQPAAGSAPHADARGLLIAFSRSVSWVTPWRGGDRQGITVSLEAGPRVHEKCPRGGLEPTAARL